MCPAASARQICCGMASVSRRSCRSLSWISRLDRATLRFAPAPSYQADRGHPNCILGPLSCRTHDRDGNGAQNESGEEALRFLCHADRKKRRNEEIVNDDGRKHDRHEAGNHAAKPGAAHDRAEEKKDKRVSDHMLQRKRPQKRHRAQSKPRWRTASGHIPSSSVRADRMQRLSCWHHNAEYLEFRPISEDMRELILSLTR